jgi:hypothetical protein
MAANSCIACGEIFVDKGNCASVFIAPSASFARAISAAAAPPPGWAICVRYSRRKPVWPSARSMTLMAWVACAGAEAGLTNSRCNWVITPAL